MTIERPVYCGVCKAESALSCTCSYSRTEAQNLAYDELLWSARLERLSSETVMPPLYAPMSELARRDSEIKRMLDENERRPQSRRGRRGQRERTMLIRLTANEG